MDPSEGRKDPVAEADSGVPGTPSPAPGGRTSIAPRRSSWTGTVIAGLLAAVTLLLVLLRFGLPVLENYRPEAEQWVSEMLQRPVSIDALKAYWRGWSPELEIHGLKLHGVDDVSAGSEPAITFDKVRIKVDPVKSLKRRRLLADAVTIVGASLTIKRREDGSIHVAGMQPTDGAAESRMAGELGRWMLSEGTLVFDATTVHWIDERRGNTPMLLTSARVELSNVGAEHRLSGTFRLPQLSRERIQFTLDASGDLSTSDWSGSTVVSINGIQASRLKALFSPSDTWVSGGKSDLSVWTRWKHGSMAGARVTIRADGLILSDLLGGLRVHGGTAEVQLGRMENGWSADVLLRDIHTSEGRWRTSRGAIDYIVDAHDDTPRLVGRFEHARLADVARLLQSRMNLIPAATAAMETYRPSADLSKLHFSIGLGAGAPEPFRLSAEFEQLSAFVGRGFPGLSGYSGKLEIDGTAGVINMNGGSVDVAMSGVFDKRFPIETHGGRVTWRQRPGGLRLAVNDLDVAGRGIDARVSGFANLDGDASGPLLTLVANMRSDDVGELKRYIPVGILKPKLTEWLHRAVRGGRVTESKLLLQGRIGDFPFDEADGILEAQFVIEDGQLDYGKGWPGLSEVAGVLSFEGRRLHAVLRQGRILKSGIDEGSVVIEHIGEGVPVVEIRGSARGDAAQGLEFLRQSPLKARFAVPTRDITAAGDVKLELAVDFPLNKRGIRVDGRVALNGNRIDFPHLESGLERVRGTLRFNRRGARAQSVDAVYLGRPVSIDVVTVPETPHDTHIRISGRAEKRFLAKHLSNSGFLAGPAPWLEQLNGETEWIATIEVPEAEPGKERRPTVHFESSLKGLAIDLPDPVGKETDGERRLSISMQPGDDERREVYLRYGQAMRAAAEIETHKDGQRIRRGVLSFGGAEAGLPKGEGLDVRGYLPELAVGEWVHAWKTALAPEAAKPPPQNRLVRVALNVDRLDLLGSGFQRVRIDAERNGDGSWNTRIDGPSLKGTVRLLDAAGQSTLIASFEQIDYRSAPPRKGPQLSDPREFPAIRLIGESVRFNGRDLGVVKLSAAPTAAGLNFGDISVASSRFEARANGYWHQLDGVQRSEFSISVHSQRLGGFLEAMGFRGSNISGGSTDVFVNAKWPASPMEFDLRRLDGALHFRSVEGKLLGVERGVPERIFGLLSVTALPRRLILDFTDLFEEGVSYDLIEGSFNLENGEAYTNNLTMETDTARVEIAGRTGLVTEDYDQVMTVTPKLTSSLPLAPLWLAEKALDSELFGKAFSAQYTITGSWADPKVEPIEVELRTEERG